MQHGIETKANGDAVELSEIEGGPSVNDDGFDGNQELAVPGRASTVAVKGQRETPSGEGHPWSHRVRNLLNKLSGHHTHA